MRFQLDTHLSSVDESHKSRTPVGAGNSRFCSFAAQTFCSGPHVAVGFLDKNMSSFPHSSLTYFLCNPCSDEKAGSCTYALSWKFLQIWESHVEIWMMFFPFTSYIHVGKSQSNKLLELPISFPKCPWKMLKYSSIFKTFNSRRKKDKKELCPNYSRTLPCTLAMERLPSLSSQWQSKDSPPVTGQKTIPSLAISMRLQD